MQTREPSIHWPGRNAVALGLASAALGLALCSGAASAATAGRPLFSRGLGAILPNDGTVAEVSVSCPENARGTCAGSVALRPREGTARSLGSGALASRSFTLARGADADLKLRLDGPARDRLSHGTLLVVAVLRRAGSGTPVATRQLSIAREQPYIASGRAAVAGAADAGSADFSWSWTIPAHHYLVLRQFSCPSDHPLVARGPHTLVYKRGIGGEWDAKIDVTAGDGTGYAGFDRPKLGPTFYGEVTHTTYRYMSGWPEGGLFYNSIWAPLSRDGRFSLTVRCTTNQGTNIARLQSYSDDPADSYYKNFFPWKWSF